jgi:thiamine kinase-like enzyme
MPDLAGDRAKLHGALSSVLGPGAAAAARPLGGGLNNTSYAVTHGGHRYVVRLPRPNAGSRLTLVDELALLRTLAAAGLTPEPVGIDEASGALLTCYVPGAKPWTPAAARDPANIERIAALLRRLHGVRARARTFAPQAYAETYVAIAGGFAALDSMELARAEELRLLAVEYESRHPASVVCHNDLAAANVLDDGELRLIDFEYAALASPILDLASLATMNDYSPEDVDALLSAYFAPSAAPFSLAEFAKVARMVGLIARFWELACARQSKS